MNPFPSEELVTFARQVEAMRHAQARFFRSKSGEDLRVAKDWERRVDERVRRVIADQHQTPSLFDAGGGEGRVA